MGNPLVLASALLIGLSLIAQKQKEKDIPGWGEIDKADLELKECDFDKNAEALVLFETGELVNNDFRPLELGRHIRIKILKDKGLEQANINILFHNYKMNEVIKNLEAQTFNLDSYGNVVVTKVEKKLIYEKKLNKRYSQMIFAFPEVKVGSIIEYRYTVAITGIGNWYFQKSIPVEYSRYTIDIPIGYEVFSKPITSLPYESKNDRDSSRNVQTFSMQNIPALRDEPYISCKDDYLQRIESRLLSINSNSFKVSYTKTWEQIIKELMEDEDFGMQLKKEIRRTSDLDAELKTLISPYEKMVAIHKYVRKNMQWNEYDNIWALEGVKSAWKDKKGTSGEINLILVNLLQDAGVDTHPVLVSTREHGLIDQFVPSTRQFDKVMAYVKIPGISQDKIYVLDATDKFTPSHLIPQDVMFSNGLVIEKLNKYECQWSWKNLWNEKQGFKNMLIMQATIDEQGMMNGNASVNSYDYTRVNRIPDLKKGKDKFVEKYFTSDNPFSKIDSLSISNEDNDLLPLVQNIQFSEPLQASGDYKYFSANMFSGLEKNPFIADTRFSDVFFGAIRNFTIIGNFMIPEDYSFDELPKNIRMILPDTSISFTRMSAVSENQLSVRINLEFKKPYYRTDEYPDFKEFYKKLFGILNEQFVIRKNAKI